MAPREPSKATPRVQRTIVKNAGSKIKTPTLKKTMVTKPTTEKKVPLKVANSSYGVRQRTNTVPIPNVATPKPKENKSVPLPGSATKSAKKATWKRRPKPAHSGVPVPDKMKKLFEKQLQNSDCSL